MISRIPQTAAPAQVAVPSPLPRMPNSDLLCGWIKTARDAVLVIEASRVGILSRVTRRFHDGEKRNIIQSGAIIVFTEEESGIKRWTDPYLWSASRMQGEFLIYREREDEAGASDASPYSRSIMPTRTDTSAASLDPELEYYIYGSWNKGRGLKRDGLMKKTISVTVEGTVHHLVSYYRPADVQSGFLQTPSSMPALARLPVSPEVLASLSQPRQAAPVDKGRPRTARSMPISSTPRSPIARVRSRTSSPALTTLTRSSSASKIASKPSAEYRLERTSPTSPYSSTSHSGWSSSPSPSLRTRELRSRHGVSSASPLASPIEAHYPIQPASMYCEGVSGPSPCCGANDLEWTVDPMYTPNPMPYDAAYLASPSVHPTVSTADMDAMLQSWKPILDEARSLTGAPAQRTYPALESAGTATPEGVVYASYYPAGAFYPGP